MKRSALVLLCCLTLIAVLIDIYASQPIVKAQTAKKVYVDEVEIRGSIPAITTRGATVLGFSCLTNDQRRFCFVASE